MQTKTSGGILTVGELKRILAAADDADQIVVATDDIGMGYANVESIATPDGHTFCAVTLFTANTYDPRQH